MNKPVKMFLEGKLYLIHEYKVLRFQFNMYPTNNLYTKRLAEVDEFFEYANKRLDKITPANISEGKLKDCMNDLTHQAIIIHHKFSKRMMKYKSYYVNKYNDFIVNGIYKIISNITANKNCVSRAYINQQYYNNQINNGISLEYILYNAEYGTDVKTFKQHIMMKRKTTSQINALLHKGIVNNKLPSGNDYYEEYDADRVSFQKPIKSIKRF